MKPVREHILSIGDRLLFDNFLTKWIDREANHIDDYFEDECNPEHIPKRKTGSIVLRFVLLLIVSSLFSVFANILAVPLCILDDDCSGRSSKRFLEQAKEQRR